MSRSVRGDINDISYIFPPDLPLPSLQGSFLGELFGLASGAKRAAILELRDEVTFDNFMAHLAYLAPERRFETLRTPPYGWQSDIKDHELNVFVGGDRADLLEIDRLWKDIPTDFNEQNIRVAPLLSYPDCCARRMGQTKDISDLFVLGRTNEIDLRVNNLYMRSASNAILTLHYSCSYECEETLEYVKKVFLFLERCPDARSFYKKVFGMPVLMVFPDRKLTRPVGDGVTFTFNGSFKDERTLEYDKVYYMGDMPGTYYLNKEEGGEMLAKILSGNRITLTEDGIEIARGGETVEVIKNDRIVAIDPKER